MSSKPSKLHKSVSISVRHLWQFNSLEPILIEIVGRGFDYAPSSELWVSSIGRTPKEDEGRSGIHSAGPPWRAVDCGWIGMTQEQIERVCKDVNSHYMYDPVRPHIKVAFGAPHGTGLHIHYQVHPNTMRVVDD